MGDKENDIDLYHGLTNFRPTITGTFELRETQSTYNAILTPKIAI